MNINKYKKIISIAMLMIIMATTFSMNAFAADEPLTVSDEKTYNVRGKDLTVLEDYPGIGLIASQLKKNIKTVTIEQGVESLVGTFQGYFSLTSVTFSDTVKVIGENAFNNCINLRDITIPEGVTEIGDRAFMGCKQLTSIKIPSSVEKIGEDAFTECSKLKSITIENGVTEIGDRAFMGCNQLTSIKIPSSVEKIGKRAFSGCNLKSITIPGSVNTIDEYIFSGCTELSSVNIEDDVNEIKAYAFSGCENLTEINIPDSVEKIGERAFGQCKKLNEVKILNSKTKISKNSFPKSTNVILDEQPQPTPDPNPTPKPERENKVVIDPITPPVSYYYVPTKGMCGKSVNFSFNESTGKLNISGMGEIERSPWADYSSEIKSISINEGVRKTGDNTFANLTNLEEVSLPNKSLIEIGKSAFEGCKNLKKIFIPDSVEKIGDYAFNGCKELNDISYKNSTYLGDYAFNECGQKKVILRK